MGAFLMIFLKQEEVMDREALPDDLRQFILTRIPSVPYLESLILLRNDPSVAWDPKSLAQRVYVSEKKAEELLSELQKAGFVDAVETNMYQFEQSSKELSAMCERLADAYSTNIVGVTNLIHSNASKQAQQFADAFKW